MPADANFCPHCGIDGLGGETPVQPLTSGDLTIRVGRRLGVGDACNLYHCTFGRRREERPGVFKIARDAGANASVSAGSSVLERIVADGDTRLLPFLPTPVTTLTYRTTTDVVGRQAVVLAYHESISEPDTLYSLAEVQEHYPQGVDARDMAWMWRRLLTMLGGVHAHRTVHAAVTPAHVLIAPNVHGLVLIGWGAAAAVGSYLMPRTAGYAEWFAGTDLITPSLDLKTGARTMLALLGQHLPTPAPLEPALRRYFDRCLVATELTDATQWLADFDRLIETLWGPRQFRAFTMPPRQSVV